MPKMSINLWKKVEFSEDQSNPLNRTMYKQIRLLIFKGKNKIFNKTKSKVKHTSLIANNDIFFINIEFNKS